MQFGHKRQKCYLIVILSPPCPPEDVRFCELYLFSKYIVMDIDEIERIGIDKILSHEEEIEFIKAISIRKDMLLLGLLQLDCCIRVSEAATLKIGEFDFKEKTINVSRLKKRKVVNDIVPYTPRVQKAIAEYWKTVEDKSVDSFMFATKYKKLSKSGHISRQQVHRIFKKLGNANPHKLRHTGISNLVQNGVPLNVVKKIAGHSSIATTSLYIWADRNSMREAIQTREPKKGLFEKMSDFLKPQKEVYLTPMLIGDSSVYVGRKNEIEALNKAVKNKIDTIIIGKSGIGKSRLLKEIQGDKILRIDDMKGIITTLTGMLGRIIELKPDEVGLLELNPNQVQRKSQAYLIDTMIQLTVKNEFTIIIDDLTSLTEVTCNVLKNLSKHFHIIGACREMLIKFGSLLTGFTKIELKELSRDESLMLIRNCSSSFRKRIDDYSLFEGHLWNQSNGNPNKILKLCEVYSVEERITVRELTGVNLLGKERTKSVMPFLLTVLLALTVVKYTGREASEIDRIGYAVIGAILMAFVIVIRFSRRSFTSKNV